MGTAGLPLALQTLQMPVGTAGGGALATVEARRQEAPQPNRRRPILLWTTCRPGLPPAQRPVPTTRLSSANPVKQEMNPPHLPNLQPARGDSLRQRRKDS